MILSMPSNSKNTIKQKFCRVIKKPIELLWNIIKDINKVHKFLTEKISDLKFYKESNSSKINAEFSFIWKGSTIIFLKTKSCEDTPNLKKIFYECDMKNLGIKYSVINILLKNTTDNTTTFIREYEWRENEFKLISDDILTDRNFILDSLENVILDDFELETNQVESTVVHVGNKYLSDSMNESGIPILIGDECILKHGSLEKDQVIKMKRRDKIFSFEVIKAKYDEFESKHEYALKSIDSDQLFKFEIIKINEKESLIRFINFLTNTIDNKSIRRLSKQKRQRLSVLKKHYESILTFL
jgi:hypothetical protein